MPYGINNMDFYDRGYSAYMDNIGKRIRALRVRKGITRQSDFGELIGIDQSTVSDIESKSRKFYADTLLRMAEVLEVSPWHIMQGGEQEDMTSIELTRVYQQLPEAERAMLLKMAQALLPNTVNRKVA